MVRFNNGSGVGKCLIRSTSPTMLLLREGFKANNKTLEDYYDEVN